MKFNKILYSCLIGLTTNSSVYAITLSPTLSQRKNISKQVKDVGINIDKDSFNFLDEEKKIYGEAIKKIIENSLDGKMPKPPVYSPNYGELLPNSRESIAMHQKNKYLNAINSEILFSNDQLITDTNKSLNFWCFDELQKFYPKAKEQ